MPIRDWALWAVATIVCTLALMGPAIWNGFPLMEWDTGGYLARWYDHTLVINRAVPYGLLLNVGSFYAFWPVLVVQSLLTIWILALMLRAHELGNRPLLLTSIIIVLSVLTTLPWLSSVLLTDIFAGLAVLALYLLVLRADVLKPWEKLGLVLFIAFSAAAHSATLAVCCGLLLVAFAASRLHRGWIVSTRLLQGAAAMVLAVLMVLGTNYLIAKKVAWTPGGFSIAFGRMLQDGIVKAYLDGHCPDPYLHLCRYKDQIPQDADQFFWHTDLFEKQLGGFEKLGPEMERIVLGAIKDYPLWQIESAAVATARQLVHVKTGEGVENTLWHTYLVIRDHLPELLPAMNAAHQQQNPSISFAAINQIHYPVALAGMALLPIVFVLGLFTGLRWPFAELAATAMLALIGNAMVCGAVSNPHDRYGARMVWIGAFIVLLAVSYAFAHIRRARSRDIPTAEPLFY
jgi:hypothetical protein